MDPRKKFKFHRLVKVVVAKLRQHDAGLLRRPVRSVYKLGQELKLA